MSTAAFERTRLRIARELTRLSQAEVAEAVGLTPAAISQFESGANQPKPETVAKLSAVLRVPTGFFEQPIIDTHEGFFRSLRRTAVADRRRARAVAHVAHDLASHATAAGQFCPLQLPQFTVSGLDLPADEIEHVAARVRRAWGIPAGPIPDVVELLERQGIVVIRMPLHTADVDAFSLPFADHPVVVLGANKNDRARSRFDAAHELGHLTMHGEQIWGMPEIEKQAHAFAAAFLMPAHEIRGQLPATVDWPSLFDLKRRWQVSLAALLMRARTLKCMSEATYLTAIKAASARGWRRVEPVPLGLPEHPRRLLAYIDSQASRTIRGSLPTDVVTAIASASAAA